MVPQLYNTLVSQAYKLSRLYFNYAVSPAKPMVVTTTSNLPFSLYICIVTRKKEVRFSYFNKNLTEILKCRTKCIVELRTILIFN